MHVLSAYYMQVFCEQPIPYCSASVQKTVAWLLLLSCLLACIWVAAVVCMVMHTVWWGPFNLNQWGISTLVFWMSYWLCNFFLPGSHVTLGKYRDTSLQPGIHCDISPEVTWLLKECAEYNISGIFEIMGSHGTSVNECTCCMRLLNTCKHMVCTWERTFALYLQNTGTFFTYYTL